MGTVTAMACRSLLAVTRLCLVCAASLRCLVLHFGSMEILILTSISKNLHPIKQMLRSQLTRA